MVNKAHGEAVAKVTFDVLVDSDAFIAWLRPSDLFYRRAGEVIRQLQQEEQPFVTTSLVILETATVLSHRDGHAIAKQFLELVDEYRLPVIHVNEELQRATIDLFRSRTSRGVSMVDCANVVVAKRFRVSRVFSFDRFYKQMGLEVLS